MARQKSGSRRSRGAGPSPQLASWASAGLLIALTSPALAQAQFAGPSGTWEADWGPMHFELAEPGLFATYEGGDYPNGRFIGQLSGVVFEGVWVEDGPTSCDDARDGSTYWGRIRLVFDENFTSFAGLWSYCDAEPASGWSGHLPSAPEPETMADEPSPAEPRPTPVAVRFMVWDAGDFLLSRRIPVGEPFWVEVLYGREPDEETKLVKLTFGQRTLMVEVQRTAEESTKYRSQKSLYARGANNGGR
jgi:hypothetical protein